jgi:N-methylhydantoinase A
VARRLGIDRVICPPAAGVASALGLLMAPARIDRVSSIARGLRDTTPSELETLFVALEGDAARVMEETLGASARFRFERAADIRFLGQGFEIVTPLPEGPFGAGTFAQVRAGFVELYRRVFAHVPPVEEIELINLRVAAIETLTERPVRFDGAGREAWKIGVASRDVWDATSGKRRRLKVLARDALEPGQDLIGPIVLEDASSTLMIPEGAVARCDASGNVIVDLKLAGQTQGAVTLAKTG